MSTTMAANGMTAHSPPIATMRLWQLISPALPVGAYAYSQGLEYAVETKWVRDEESASRWILGHLGHNLSGLDLPILQRSIRAWNDDDARGVAYWNRYLLCARETRELRHEDRQMGAALRRLLHELGVDRVRGQLPEEIGFICMFALAASTWRIPEQDVCHGYAWAWCENQVAASVKLIPLGQSAGQRILLRVPAAVIEAVGRASERTDADLGGLSVGLAIASVRHEMQYTRLFRS